MTYEYKLEPLKRNGISRPEKPDSITGRVWWIADHLASKAGNPNIRQIDVINMAKEENINGSTAKKQFGNWAIFHGIRKPNEEQAKIPNSDFIEARMRLKVLAGEFIGQYLYGHEEDIMTPQDLVDFIEEHKSLAWRL